MTQHEHPNAALFRRAVEAFNRGDVQGFTDMLAADGGQAGRRTLTYQTVEIMHLWDGRVTQRWSFAHDTQAVREFFA